jgi:hypothetical protein
MEILYYGIFGAVAARLVTALVAAGCCFATVRQSIGLRIERPVMIAVIKAVMLALLAPFEIGYDLYLSVNLCNNGLSFFG